MMQDQDIACVAVVDLYGGSLTAPAPAGSSAAAASGAKPGLFPLPLRCKLCTLHFVDPQMFRSRPGLVVHQVGSGCFIFTVRSLTLPSLSEPPSRPAGTRTAMGTWQC